MRLQLRKRAPLGERRGHGAILNIAVPITSVNTSNN